jgi:hypothetical protein
LLSDDDDDDDEDDEDFGVSDHGLPALSPDCLSHTFISWCTAATVVLSNLFFKTAAAISTKHIQ